MAVKEIIFTKKECFTILENGNIIRQVGKYEPSQCRFVPTRFEPPRPEESGVDLVQHNIWGQEIYREDEAIREWRIKCEAIRELNKEDKKKAEKEFKRHLIEIRKSYYKQEKLRAKEEKEKKKAFEQTRRESARGALLRAFQDRNGCIKY